MKTYTVVQEIGINALIIRVNEFLKEGWELQGGICAVGGNSTGTGHAYYHQAMYKIIK